MSDTMYYTDVMGRTTELDFDDIIRREEMMYEISKQSEYERLVYDMYRSSEDE